MSLVTPDLVLKYQQSPGEPIEFFLESEAKFQDESFIEDGYNPVPTVLNNSNELVIELLLEDSDPANSSSPSIVNHFVALGSLDFGLAEFDIVVELKKGGVKKGKGHTKNSNAIGFTRPGS